MKHGHPKQEPARATATTATAGTAKGPRTVGERPPDNRDAKSADHPTDTAQEVTPMQDEASEILNRRHELVYSSKLGFLYHRKRERFFDLCDKVTKSVTVLLGASLLGSFVKDLVPLVGAIVSAIGLLALVFGYTDRKQRHKELADAYAELMARTEAIGQGITLAQLDLLHGELHKLNAKEPPTLGTLVVLCQNEIAIAEGHPDSVVKVSAYKQLFANWRDFHTAT